MGFISSMLGRDDEPTGEPEPRRSALEQADDPEQQKGLNGAAITLVRQLLDTGIDGRGPFDPAATVADAALAKHSGDVEKAVDEVLRDHLRLAAANGFVTNLGGFVTLPVALPANVLGFYVLATRMAASVAALRGHDLADDRIRTAILLSLVGADAQEVLARAGMVAPTGRMTHLATQRLPGPALMVINKGVGFRLLASAGRSTFARFGRAIPVVGGAVGAGLDTWLMKQLADHVREEFPAAGEQVGALAPTDREAPGIEGSAAGPEQPGEHP